MYTRSQILTSPEGTNAFSYKERRTLLGKAEITIPSLKRIDTIHEIELGKHVVIEEIDHTGKLRSCTGLTHIYHIKRSSQDIYIFDNHNHALTFWMINNNTTKYIVHIDQHSDLANNTHSIDPAHIVDKAYIQDFAVKKCNVGNFIKPYLTLFPTTEFSRIKSEQQLLDYNKATIDILDIDLDFRAPEMHPEKKQETISITKDLLINSPLVTIATSPYFLDQDLALSLLSSLLE